MLKALSCGAALLVVALPALARTELNLEQIEVQALRIDPRIQQRQALAAAGRERSIAAGELPDPRLRLALDNLPVDSFRLDEEPMAMVAVGVMQTFPGGTTRELRRDRAQALAGEAGAATEVQRLVVMREVREAWLGGFAAEAARRLVEAAREVAGRSVGVAEANYRAGRTVQSAAIEARLLLADLDERSAALRGDADAARANLRRWSDAGADAEWPAALPEALRRAPKSEDVDAHPEIREAEVQRERAELDIELAQQAYKPDWGLEARYGFRDGIPDLVSVGLDIGLPWFTGKRQDRDLAAAHSERLAARLAEQDRRLTLATRRGALQASTAALDMRIEIIEAQVLPERAALMELTHAEYRSGGGSLDAVLKAESAAIEARRQLLDLQVERARQIIELRYLNGESGS